MARVVKQEEYNAKRNEILDVVLGLIYSKGYAQMTIQDILDGLQISRGALYHYFDSKQAVLEALVERMGNEAEQTYLPVVQDSNLSALQKLSRYFEVSVRFKNSKRDLIVNILRSWYTDENALIRQKMTWDSVKWMAQLVEPIIRQGIEEKVFTTRFPEQAAEILAGLPSSLMDSMVELLLSPVPDQVDFEKFGIILDAYVDAVERILGAPSGSLSIFEKDSFKHWFCAEPTE